MNSVVPIPLGDCPEDVNRDGTVDRVDLDIVLNYSQTDQCPTGEICWADVNGDYRVDQQDVTQVIEAFGTCGQGRWAEGYEPLVEVWTYSGGMEGLGSGTIETTEVEGSLEQPTPAEKLASLYSLIGQ